MGVAPRRLPSICGIAIGGRGVFAPRIWFLQRALRSDPVTTGSAPQLDQFQKRGHSRPRHGDACRAPPRCDLARPDPRARPHGRRAAWCGAAGDRPAPGRAPGLAERPHAAADAVSPGVRAELGAVSTQGVYDVLRDCSDAGIVRRIQPAGHPARYELRVGDNHHHLVCRRCGAAATSTARSARRRASSRPTASASTSTRRRSSSGALPRLPGDVRQSRPIDAAARNIRRDLRQGEAMTRTANAGRHDHRRRHPGRERRALADRRPGRADPAAGPLPHRADGATSTGSASPSASRTPRAAAPSARSR